MQPESGHALGGLNRREEGGGKREEGRGKREEGRGKKAICAVYCSYLLVQYFFIPFQALAFFFLARNCVSKRSDGGNRGHRDSLEIIPEILGAWRGIQPEGAGARAPGVILHRDEKRRGSSFFF